MPQSIPKGLNRDHVLKAIADLDTGFAHPFGKPTGYELVYGENRYAPKAVGAGTIQGEHLIRIRSV